MPQQAIARERNGIRELVLRPGISDFICLGLVLLVSLAGVILEPPHRDFWGGFPLLVELPLLCAAVLLLSRSVIAAKIAAFLHIAILVGSGLCVALSLFLVVTILFAGLGIILLPVAALVALNSAYTLKRIGALKREALVHASVQ
jgi:hypothetical protein